MGTPRLAAGLIALALVAFGCNARQPTLSPTEVAALPSPSAQSSIAPAPTANPCARSLEELANSSQLMADKLVSIRGPLTASTYDGWKILGLARSTNATLQLYALSIPSLGACPEAADLAERLGQVTTSARRQIAIVLAAGAAAEAAPRQAMVGLVELLPEVIGITKAASDLASTFAIDLAVATVPEGATGPLGKLAALPEAPKPPTTAGIKAAFFGSGVTLETFRVTGSTPFEISQSMSRSGPISEWTGGRADGQTLAKPAYRFGLLTNQATGSCSLSTTASPAILITYTVTLPRWAAPSGATSATKQWWNELVLEIATHEKHHIAIYRDGQRDLNETYASSSCSNVEARLLAVWADVNRRQCAFDMKEYGYALGLSLEDCVAR